MLHFFLLWAKIRYPICPYSPNVNDGNIRTDPRTYGRTDSKPSCRDARTHLKTRVLSFINVLAVHLFKKQVCKKHAEHVAHKGGKKTLMQIKQNSTDWILSPILNNFYSKTYRIIPNKRPPPNKRAPFFFYQLLITKNQKKTVRFSMKEMQNSTKKRQIFNSNLKSARGAY